MRRIKTARAALSRFLGRYHYLHRSTGGALCPQIYAIEVTNYCNLDCVMCPRQAMRRPVGYMDSGLFKKIIAHIRGINTFVWLHNFGEPLFHPQIGEFIAAAAAAGISPYLSTNATILDEKRGDMLLDSPLQKLVISLDGANAETFQKVRKGSDYARTVEQVTRFLREKKRRGKRSLEVVLQIIRMKETESQIEQFRTAWKDLADTISVQRFCTWADQVDGIRGLADTGSHYYPGRRTRFPCQFLWESAVVLWNGDVVPCCRDFDGKLVFGNLMTCSLEQVWRSPLVRNLRRQQINGTFSSVCAHCTEWVGTPPDQRYPLSARFVTDVFGTIPRKGS